MQTNKYGFVFSPCPFYQSSMFKSVTWLTESDKLKITFFRWKFNFFPFFYDGVSFKSISDKVFNGNDLNIEFMTYFNQIFQPGH